MAVFEAVQGRFDRLQVVGVPELVLGGGDDRVGHGAGSGKPGGLMRELGAGSGEPGGNPWSVARGWWPAR